MKSILAVAAIALAGLTGCDNSKRIGPSSTSPAPSSTSGRTSEPDNTAVNERDRDADTKTPIDQNENQKDISTTAEIRKRVLATKDMSVDGRNVKIITAEGKVTLRGPVASDDERKAIDKIAREVAGDANVDNQIEITGKE
jgi:hyperosmotically inducible protein